MMDKVAMTSLTSHRYGKATIEAGEDFEAHPNDVKLLMGLGRAQYRGGVAPAPPIKKVMKAAKKSSAKKTPKGEYNRRDLRARS